MVDAKRCICRGQEPHILLSAFYARARKRIAAGVVNGKPAPSIKDLATTITLIRALGVGEAKKAPFQARFAHLDIHLETCPCSPNYKPSKDPLGA